MFEVNRMGFTNQFVNGSRFVEEFDYAASFVETRRECVVGFVEEGHSRREAARIFKTAASTTVRIMRRFRETDSVEARPRGGFRHGKLPQHRDFI